MCSKKHNISIGTFTRSHQGLFDYVLHREGKVEGWVNLGDMKHLSSFKKDRQCFVQFIQAYIFSVAHYHISVLIDRIIVITGDEQWWLH